MTVLRLARDEATYLAAYLARIVGWDDRAAVDELDLPAEQDTELWAYLEMAAHGLVNTYDDPSSPAARA